MVEEKLYTMLVDKISEISKSNDCAHKALSDCLVGIKVKIGKIETHCNTAANEHTEYLHFKDKTENRIEKVEAVTSKVEELPGKFDGLVKKVFTINGIMVVLLIIAGMWLKKGGV